MFRVEDAILILFGIQGREGVADKGGVDGAVDDGMHHVDAFRSQLPGQTLRQRTQGKLGTGEGGEALAAPHRGGGAGEDDGALVARHHHPGGFATGQEASEGPHFPDLAIDPGGSIADGEEHVGADVEHHHFHRPHFVFDGVEQRHHLVFIAGVAAEWTGLAAGLFDLLHQGRQGFFGTAGDAGGVAFAGKTFGDGTAGGITGTDYNDGGFRHGASWFVAGPVVGSYLELIVRSF